MGQREAQAVSVPLLLLVVEIWRLRVRSLMASLLPHCPPSPGGALRVSGLSLQTAWVSQLCPAAIRSSDLISSLPTGTSSSE